MGEMAGCARAAVGARSHTVGPSAGHGGGRARRRGCGGVDPARGVQMSAGARQSGGLVRMSAGGVGRARGVQKSAGARQSGGFVQMSAAGVGPAQGVQMSAGIGLARGDPDVCGWCRAAIGSRAAARPGRHSLGHVEVSTEGLQCGALALAVGAVAKTPGAIASPDL